MAQRFHTCSLDQPLLLPVDLRDWVDEDHLARFLAEVFERLDLSSLMQNYQRNDPRGRRGYHPVVLCRVLVYAYCLGILSSRRIESAIVNDIGFRFLAAGQCPDHSTISAFRLQHGKVFETLFVQVLRLCQAANLLKLGTLALDGSKMKANASRHESYDYEELAQKIESMKAQVADLLQRADQQNRLEDELDSTPVERMPDGVKKASQRLEALELAQQRLEELARQKAAQSQAEQEHAMAEGRRLSAAERKRKQRAEKAVEGRAPGQTNLTDPESRLMRDSSNSSFLQAYNVQAIVDTETQIIVAARVTADVVDRNQLAPMVAELNQNLEALQAQTEEADSMVVAADSTLADAEAVPHRVLLADSGYWNGQSLESEALSGYRVIVPPGKQTTGPLPANAPMSEAAQRMRNFLATEEGTRLYRKRQSSIEPVFGQVKDGRKIRGFLLRGLENVAIEWNLICLTHNLLKVFRARLTATAVA